MSDQSNITPEYLESLLRYDAEAGKLFWRERGAEWFKDGYRTAQGEANNWNVKYAGKEAGCVAQNGYRYIHLPQGRNLLSHRIIFCIENGHWPKVCDHLNGDTLDNRISNLRDGSQHDNMRNARKWSHNTSGKTGVHFDKRRGAWMAYIKVNQKSIYLGHRDVFSEAAALRKDAEMKYGFSERHGR